MNNKQQIIIEFDYSKELFREAYKSLFDQKVKPQNFIWLGLLLVLVFFFTYKGDNNFWLYLPLFGLPLGFVFARFFLTKKWGDKAFKQYEGKKVTWVIGSKDIQITGRSTATVQWDYFEKATVGKEVILLITIKKVLTPLPVSAFTGNDLEQFKIWVDEKIYK